MAKMTTQKGNNTASKSAAKNSGIVRTGTMSAADAGAKHAGPVRTGTMPASTAGAKHAAGAVRKGTEGPQGARYVKQGV